MLGILNPRYATDLISQAIPQTRLLGRAFSPLIGYLAGSPLGSSASRWIPRYTLTLPVHSDTFETVTIGRFQPEASGRLLEQRDSHNASFKAFFHDNGNASGLSPGSLSSSESLELLFLFLLLFLLSVACGSIKEKFRVRQPLSTAPSVVEEVLAQAGPKAFTPSNSFEVDGQTGSDVEEESSPIPAKLEFAASGSTFVLNTHAALDAILALPTRVCLPPTVSSGGIDELEPAMSSPGPVSGSFGDSSGSCGSPKSVGQPACADASASNSDASPVLPSPEASPTTEETEARPAPRARTRTGCPPSPLLEGAVMFKMVKTGRPTRMAGKTDKQASPIPHSASGPSFAFIEEVKEPLQQVSRPSVQSPAQPVTPCRDQAYQRPLRPKLPPPVTVWPRMPLEPRRSRTPSSQPIRMTYNTPTWDQPRRSRTVSGI